MKFSHFIAISLCGIMNVACQVDEVEVPSEERFTRAFIKEFGMPDPEQDWNLATRITAIVDPATVQGAETICIYSCMPGGDDCHLAARYSSASASFAFDFPRSATRAYVQAFDHNGTSILSGYYPISDNTLTISSAASRADSDEVCSIKVKDITNYDEVTKSFTEDFLDKGIKLYGMYDTSEGEEWICWGKESHAKFDGDLFNTQEYGSDQTATNNYLKPDFSNQTIVKTTSDLAKIVGRNGVFHEGTINGNSSCNIEKYKKLLSPESGVIYTPKTNDTEIAIEYIYGAGIYHNSFGYFYYKDNATEAEKLNAPMLMLMFDASNTKRKYTATGETEFSFFVNYEGHGSDNQDRGWEGITNFAGMLPSNDIDGYEQEKRTSEYLASTYRLVYYPIKSDGSYDLENGTYKFPKDVRIGFFIICQGYPKMICKGAKGIIPTSDFRFSEPSLNKAIGNNFSNKHNETYSTTDPAMSFVTYNFNGEVVMGVEDGSYEPSNTAFSDHDMNDILFYVHGVQPPSGGDLSEGPKAQSWIIACEDLGSSYDFDFNDVVFGVSHFSTDDETQNYLKVKALAAGGTLPVQLYWTDKNGTHHNVGTEYNQSFQYWNNWFGIEDRNSVINCYDSGSNTHEGAVVEIPLNDYTDYTITNTHFQTGADSYTAMGGFSLMVYDEDNPTSGKRWVKPIGNYENISVGESWNNAPQMILVHSSWKWPIEMKPIFDAYSGYDSSSSDKKSGFSTWVQNRFATDWTEYISDQSWVVSHSWTGENPD